jgi:L-aspartate oxidase
MGQRFYERFPTITASCRAIGIDPAVDRIPVAPAAHYVCGGVRADLDGRTELAGLYAIGEVACTGLHGANRLASNSLTEGVVAGTRVGRELAWELPESVQPDVLDIGGETGLVAPDQRAVVRAAMSRHVGVMRYADGLHIAAETLKTVSQQVSHDVTPTRAAFEATNLLTIAAAVVVAATERTESRGCHRRSDFPEPRPVWLCHLTERLDAAGAPRVLGRPEGV